MGSKSKQLLYLNILLQDIGQKKRGRWPFVLASYIKCSILDLFSIVTCTSSYQPIPFLSCSNTHENPKKLHKYSSLHDVNDHSSPHYTLRKNVKIHSCQGSYHYFEFYHFTKELRTITGQAIDCQSSFFCFCKYM